MGSVRIRSADRDAVGRAVRRWAARCRADHPEVERVIWFGSWVDGVPTPGSDVDLCLVLAGSHKRFRDRAPDYLPVGFPVGVDLLVYTRDEFERLEERSPGLHRAIARGVDV